MWDLVQEILGRGEPVPYERCVIGSTGKSPEPSHPEGKRERVRELLRELHRGGATICMVTHDPRFAKHAQREVHLFDGKVVAEEELKKLMADVHA